MALIKADHTQSVTQKWKSYGFHQIWAPVSLKQMCAYKLVQKMKFMQQNKYLLKILSIYTRKS